MWEHDNESIFKGTFELTRFKLQDIFFKKELIASISIHFRQATNVLITDNLFWVIIKVSITDWSNFSFKKKSYIKKK